ncbi:MAG: 1,2-phenylacetyl-CoA epoxidase subunit PaaC [Saprospiraceae bacterium]|nr:1,2-phenylacetyl-CoA epoxidase subunit PaaC [Saprospiraceae bacterium]
MDVKIKYLLHLADNPLILGQRLGEWCGHGPVLEQDIALTNISLDLIGQARLLYQYIASLPGQHTHEDALAMLRYENEYYNLLLVEQANKNFGHTIMRQFLYDAFNLLQYESLTSHPDPQLNAIAVKSLKEIKYHYRYSSEWVIRLGDGTEESHAKMQVAINELWRYTGEMFTLAYYESALLAEGVALDISLIQPEWQQRVSAVAAQAGLKLPEGEVMLYGGKEGRHTEQMGYILTELQYMQRTYPQMTW